jgi:hypothetical protein
LLIKINIEGEHLRRIKQLIDDGAYKDLHEFLLHAIRNQIEDESSKKESADILSSESQFTIPEKSTSISTHTYNLKAGSEYSRALSEQVTHFREHTKKITAEESEFQPKPTPLIWSFYNRFFPVKVTIIQLAAIVAESERWVRLDSLRESACNFANLNSENLKDYEEEHKIPRNHRLSTGLPIPESTINEFTGRKKTKQQMKLESSRTRFMDQFVGRVTINKKTEEKTFHGAPFSMGLMAMRFRENTWEVSLTEDGRYFAMLKNPILDEYKRDRAFSEEERKFIISRIIPKFKLEKILVDRIMSEVKNRELTAEDINEIIDNEKKKYTQMNPKEKLSLLKEEYATQQRIATMGRLSELGLVNWNMDKKGSSVYSYKNSKS